jgi:hypothetical protein
VEDDRRGDGGYGNRINITIEFEGSKQRATDEEVFHRLDIPFVPNPVVPLGKTNRDKIGDLRLFIENIDKVDVMADVLKGEPTDHF